MSRVSYAMMHPEGAGEMTAAVRKALDGLIASLAMRAGIKRVEILELALVGNPIMHHLFLGIDPTPLGGAPFALATDRAVSTTAAELGLRAHPGRARLRPALHRRPCRGRHGRGDPRRAAAPGRADDARRRRRDERRDRPRRQAPTPGRLEPDRPRLRGRPDLGRPARGPGRHRARPHRPRDARAALPGHRRRRLVRRAGVRDGVTEHRASPASAARASSRSSPRCSWPGSSPRTASSMATLPRARRASCRRPDLQLRPPRGRRIRSRAAHRDHPERRAGHPARQGGAVCRRPAADGPARDRRCRRDQAGGRLREPDRPAARDDPRADPRLRPRPTSARRATRPGPAR